MIYQRFQFLNWFFIYIFSMDDEMIMILWFPLNFKNPDPFIYLPADIKLKNKRAAPIFPAGNCLKKAKGV